MKKRNQIILFFLVIGIFFTFWFFSIRHPSYLFSKNFNYKNFEIHWNNKKLDTIKLKSILDKTEIKTKESIYFNIRQRNLFICNNKVLYSFFSPTNANGLATNYVRNNNIFIANIDLENELSKSLFRDYKEKLDKLLAHEITHSLLNEKGFIRSDKWIKEGYCEYIAYDKKDNLLSDYKKYLFNNDIYIKYRMSVSFLMIKKEMLLIDIINSDLTLNEVFKEIEEKLITAHNLQ